MNQNIIIKLIVLLVKNKYYIKYLKVSRDIYFFIFKYSLEI